MLYLNIGCGSRFHPDWINIDLKYSDPHVKNYDIRQGIPYAENSCDVVYHSHLLEHLTKKKALFFIQECYRVLKPGGIIRVVVPDLERIVRTYLKALEKALKGESVWQLNYEWIMLEMYDQAVREYPGGAMLEYLSKDYILNKDFIYERVGEEAKKAIQKKGELNEVNVESGRLSFRERLIKKFLGKDDYRALQVGRFRYQGEIHQWMYDRYSLKQLLEQVGFHEIVQRTAFDSYIKRWEQYYLDASPEGVPYRPDSLYMEGLKSPLHEHPSHQHTR